MKSLGIELKGSTCIGILVDDQGSPIKSLKLELSDSYDCKSVNDFFKAFEDFFKANSPDQIVVKKRNEKGKFAGGAASFKMEGLIQLASEEKASFISGAQLNSFSKKLSEIPEVKKYQSQALFCAIFGLNV